MVKKWLNLLSTLPWSTLKYLHVVGYVMKNLFIHREDPIEDIVEWRCNQGNSGRAMNVQADIEGRKVVLNKESVYVTEVMG